MAHACGLGGALELKALRTALEVRGRPAGSFLSLNLSPSTIISREAQRALPADLSGFVIEVLETELLSESGRLDAALEELRRRGGWPWMTRVPAMPGCSSWCV
jgi:EAL domain-containing protein (putative c-di-GMP-specific phosphodiesterase class I)